MTRHRVAVTGLGLIGPYGSSPNRSFDRLMAGESAIRAFIPEPSLLKTAMPAVVCDQFNAEAALGRMTAYMTDRYAQLGIAAALAAWEDAGLPCGTPPEEQLRGAVVGAQAWVARVRSSRRTSTSCNAVAAERRRC